MAKLLVFNVEKYLAMFVMEKDIIKVLTNIINNLSVKFAKQCLKTNSPEIVMPGKNMV